MPFRATKLRSMVSNLRKIRLELGMTQAAVASVFGCTKSMVSQYERGTPIVPVGKAQKLIAEARSRGMNISYDDIYANAPTPQPAARAA